MMRPALLLSSLGALFGAVKALPQAAGGSSTRACNNFADLCQRPYNDVNFMGVHNIAFLRDESTSNSISGNHFLNATHALDAGVRLLQSQVHDQGGVLHLCHGSCGLLDAGPLVNWLASVNDWLARNPNEVITILLVNGGNSDVTKYAEAFASSGIAERGFAPTAPGEWPSLGEMIDSGNRVVSFVTGISESPESPYLLDEFAHVFETSFEVTTLDGFNCTLDRPQSQGTADAALANGYLSLLNHFKYQNLVGSFAGNQILVPDTETLDVVNSAGRDEAGNLGSHLATCMGAYQRVPNFALVDFWNVGDVMAAADNINGLSDKSPEGRTEPDPVAVAAAGGFADSRSLGRGALVAFLAGVFLLLS